MPFARSLLLIMSLPVVVMDLTAATPLRTLQGTLEEAKVLAREVARSYNLQVSPSLPTCASPYDHFWFEAFEKLDLDEFGLPVCTVLQAGASEGDLVLRYRFSPAPAVLALKATLDREVNRLALSSREAQRWSRLRSRVNWLALAQTGWITLIAKDRRIVKVDYTCPWESQTQNNEERVSLQRLRETLLALRSRPMPVGEP